MKFRVINKVIPEHVETTTEYEASDGKIFYKESECLEYEKKLNIKYSIESHPVFKSRREILMYPDDNNAWIYYIRNDEDHDFLIDTLLKIPRSIIREDDFLELGAGVYFLIFHDGGDSRDWYELKQLGEYIEDQEREFYNWKMLVNDLKNASVASYYRNLKSEGDEDDVK